MSTHTNRRPADTLRRRRACRLHLRATRTDRALPSSGILNCLGAVSIFCLWPGGIYSLIVGIFEIMYATKILPDPIRTSRMNKALAIMEIINIINFSIISVVAGVLSLVFYNDQQVQAYYYEMQRRGVPG